MRKRISKSLCLLLCLTIFCSVSAYATETRASDQISLSYATLSSKSNGDLSLFVSITATGIMDILGVDSIEIQSYNGDRWVEEYSCTVDDMPALQTSDASYYGKSFTYTPMYLTRDYRAIVTFYAEDSYGSTTRVITSNTV